MAKIGIALAGGGARGAYQVGAWKALKEHGIMERIDAFSGASVGSINAVLFAMGNYDLAEDIWMSLPVRDLFQVKKRMIFRRIFKEKLDFLDRGVYNTKKLQELMDDTIDMSLIEGKEIYVSTTYVGDKKSKFIDLLKANYKHFWKKDNHIKYTNVATLDVETIKKTVLASCAIPVAFQSITIGDQTFYDGGILDNVPCQPLIEAGCDKIIVIDLFKFQPLSKKVRKSNVELIRIKPKRGLRGVLDFKRRYVERRFEMGYLDTLKVIDEIKELVKEK